MALDFEGHGAPLRAPVLSITQLNRLVADLIESRCPAVWVAGEISNFTRAASGHWYFTLKDAGAQVRCVMFRGRAQAVGFVPREGDRIEARGLPGLYQPRGDFQLGVEQMRRAGAGDLYQQFLRIKERLLAEGLFEARRKRDLPAHPRAVGVITSPQAAALRDVLVTLRQRAPHVPVVVYPTPVQGADAPAGLVAALGAAARRAECDVLLLVRGGGSIEDLWSFNDEKVARAIAESPIPVVSGVGHETDVTIADFVADLRAATPTAAATAAVPSRADALARLSLLAQHLARRQARVQEQAEQRLDLLARGLRSPRAYWSERAGALQGLAERLSRSMRVRVARGGDRLAQGEDRLRPPDVELATRTVVAAARRLCVAGASQGRAQEARLVAAAQQLELVSPQAVLARGYAILQTEQGRVVRSASEVSPGDRLDATLAQGRIGVRVEGS